MALPIWALKVLPYVGAVVLVGGAVYYIDHRGYKRAEAEATARENERLLLVKDIELKIQESIHQSELRMQGQLIALDAQLSEKIAAIETINRTIVQPTLVKEIASDPRFSDPSLGITDGMHGAINRARSLSQRPCAPGADARNCFSLPTPEPTP